MYYIRSVPENDNYGAPQSTSAPEMLALPDELLDAYIATMGFAVLEVSEGTVTAVTANQTALDAYLNAQPQASPTQQREDAYNTEALIPWEGKTLTVTEAAQLWQYYAAEGDTETAAALTALIAEAKAGIRQRFPEQEGDV